MEYPGPSKLSCASILKGTSQVVTINSNVKGATVSVNGVDVGKTPFTGPIPRGSETALRLEKAGYEEKTITLYTEVEPVFWGNIIFGGSFGSSTDYGTGAMYRYSPSTFDIDLAPLPELPAEGKPHETAAPASSRPG